MHLLGFVSIPFREALTPVLALLIPCSGVEDPDTKVVLALLIPCSGVVGI